MSKVFLLFLLTCAAPCQAAPHRAAPHRGHMEAPRHESIPDLRMHTYYGELRQCGRALLIENNPRWIVTGYIRADGCVVLLWVYREDGRSAIGIYDFIDGELRGKFRWCDSEFPAVHEVIRKTPQND